MNERSHPLTAPSSSPVPAGHSRLWLLGLVVLLAWQAWLTLGLFDARRRWQCLFDETPVLSGRHPLHLYHGYLGARALLERGGLSCYDPAFHAGYPKTPVFDPGSRPAELALVLGGGSFRPAAYKIGLAVLCLIVPAGLYLAARWAGLDRGPATLASLFALLVWWGDPGRATLEAGDVDLLFATLLILMAAGLLVRFHRTPDVRGLLGLVGAGALAWFAHPLLCLLAAPVFLLYYLTVGPKHRLAWHGTLFLGLSAALAANAFWLDDWVNSWWIHIPICHDLPAVRHSSLQALWQSPLWGGPEDRLLAVVLLTGGLVGAALLERRGLRSTARMAAVGLIGLLALVAAGVGCEPFARPGARHLVPPALLLAAVPAAVTLASLLGRLAALTGGPVLPAVLLIGLPAAFGLASPEPARQWARHLIEPTPLCLGYGPERLALVEAVQQHTDGQGRILWEDRPGPPAASRWSALLPLLTDRAYLGGLDAEAGIEHAANGLVNGRLAGRPLAEWTDADLDAYARRYNLGWVVAWTADSRERLRRWPAAVPGPPLPTVDGEQPALFTLRRGRNYALAGAARWLSADTRGVLLADVVGEAVPGEEERQVVLSLHYQAGMRVRPGRVRLERAVDCHDAIPFVRLRLREPVGRVLISWEGR